MEDIFEYKIIDIDAEPPIYKAKDIEGLMDLMAAIVEEKDVAGHEEIYQRAVAYLKAQRWSWSSDLKQASFGKQAMGRILAGEDPARVLEDMESSWAAFTLAQEG